MMKKKIAAFGDWTLWWAGGSNGWTTYHLRHRQRRVSGRLGKLSDWLGHNGSRFAKTYELGALQHGQPELYQWFRSLVRTMS